MHLLDVANSSSHSTITPESFGLFFLIVNIEVESVLSPGECLTKSKFLRVSKLQ